jgi:hypothetical protein
VFEISPGAPDCKQGQLVMDRWLASLKTLRLFGNLLATSQASFGRSRHGGWSPAARVQHPMLKAKFLLRFPTASTV